MRYIRFTSADLPALSKQILEGKIRGRVVVEIGA